MSGSSVGSIGYDKRDYQNPIVEARFIYSNDYHTSGTEDESDINDIRDEMIMDDVSQSIYLAIKNRCDELCIPIFDELCSEDIKRYISKIVLE